jgi:hypothetical protein
LERFQPRSEVSIARLPIALEKRIIDAGYVPWDPLQRSLEPGDIIKHVGKKLEWRYSQQDCFKSLPSPATANQLQIQSVSVKESGGNFGIDFLNVSQGDLKRNGITSFDIALTDVVPLEVPSSYLEKNHAHGSCAGDLEREDHFPISSVLRGKIRITFYGFNEAGGKINLSHALIENLKLSAQVFIEDFARDSLVSNNSLVLGFAVPGTSAEDFLKSIGIGQREINEANLLKSYTMTEKDKEAEVQTYRLLNELQDTTHTLAQEIIELWIDDVEFSISKYKGRAIGKNTEPLVVSTYTSGTLDREKIWDEETQGIPDIDGIQGYEPLTLSKVGVGRSFSLIQVTKGVNTFCGDDREYDFYTFTSSSRFKYHEGLSFIFLLKKNKAEGFKNQPIQLIELGEKQHMYLPRFVTDFIIDNLRSDYGVHALEQIFQEALVVLRKAYPTDKSLRELKVADYEGYKVTLRPGDRKYAVGFKCKKPVL